MVRRGDPIFRGQCCDSSPVGAATAAALGVRMCHDARQPRHNKGLNRARGSSCL